MFWYLGSRDKKENKKRIQPATFQPSNNNNNNNGIIEFILMMKIQLW